MQDGKLKNLKLKVARNKVDIFGLSEMKWPKAEYLWNGDYKLLHTGTVKNKLKSGKVGKIMSKIFKKISRNLYITEKKYYKPRSKRDPKNFKLIKDKYSTIDLPLDFSKCNIIPILKKSTANKCDQYYPISILTHVSKF